MKHCETCGKELKKESEIFTVNGFIQCHDCAHPRVRYVDKASAVNSSNNNANNNTNNNSNVNPTIPQPQQPIYANLNNSQSTNKWASIIKISVSICIVLEIIASIIGGIAVGIEIGSSIGFVAALGILIGGIIFSIVSNSLIMCFAQMAQDVSEIKNKLNK